MPGCMARTELFNPRGCQPRKRCLKLRRFSGRPPFFRPHQPASRTGKLEPMNLTYIAMACGLIALLYGIITSRQVLSMSAGNQRMIEVAAAIQEGAGAYLRRQYTTIAIVGIIVAIIIGIFLKPLSAIAFLIGAILSGSAGFIGMNISVRANVRTAEAARGRLQSGLTTAFRAGAVTGMLVAGLALLAITGLFW